VVAATLGAARLVGTRWQKCTLAGFRTFHSLGSALGRDVTVVGRAWNQSVGIVSPTQGPCEWIPEKDYGETKRDEDHSRGRPLRS